ncbi:hypothetical protein L1987_14895 [Smallanthus sonchifolius]|uniref:Uncharacterized protein n=1 Tax=Smallanthus sonchifolius TaxID=185202 RepID=A0ACB9J4K8_9ASTR|nr:hypothetical protein L1987_14895 [Smallanthus sonchifolius]
MYTISIRNSYDLKNLDLVELHGMLKTYELEMSQDSNIMNNKKGAEVSTPSAAFFVPSASTTTDGSSSCSNSELSRNEAFMTNDSEYESTSKTLLGYTPYYPKSEPKIVGTSKLQNVKFVKGQTEMGSSSKNNRQRNFNETNKNKSVRKFAKQAQVYEKPQSKFPKRKIDLRENNVPMSCLICGKLGHLAMNCHYNSYALFDLDSFQQTFSHADVGAKGNLFPVKEKEKDIDYRVSFRRPSIDPPFVAESSSVADASNTNDVAHNTISVTPRQGGNARRDVHDFQSI